MDKIVSEIQEHHNTILRLIEQDFGNARTVKIAMAHAQFCVSFLVLLDEKYAGILDTLLKEEREKVRAGHGVLQSLSGKIGNVDNQDNTG